VPSALTIPGVQVRTDFEPAPVLPGATGILGVVGVVDRGPLLPTPIGNFAEFIDQFGLASRYSLPEVRTAFANGVQQMCDARGSCSLRPTVWATTRSRGDSKSVGVRSLRGGKGLPKVA
jgi:hypothetical protein